MTTFVVVLLVVVVLLLAAGARTIRVVPQATAGVVERFGRYHRTLSAGRNVVIPFVDRMRAQVDLREQAVSFPPQPITTRDKLVISIDFVVYFQVVNAKDATYEVANYVAAVEQLATTRMREVVGGMDLENTMTTRDDINNKLKEALDEHSKRWGLQVSWIELKAIDPPPSIQEALENEMRAERDRKASLSVAESEKQAAILRAEGDKQAAVLRARGEAEAAVQRSKGEAEAIDTISTAIREARADERLLVYKYLQTLPQIAEGGSNTVWVVPGDMSQVLQGLGGSFDIASGTRADAPSDADGPSRSGGTSSSSHA